MLSSSLFALTTHFAQVQFRLRQIVEANADDKEDLLKNLEEFAFRGIPDIASVRENISLGDTSLSEAVSMRCTQQIELINKLKDQLHELEQYAFESGHAGVPQNVILERQRVILNELKDRMNLELDEDQYHQLTPDAVKAQVDQALGQFVSPLKMKEHLVAQLKTQVADLERFIGYLQVDSKNAKCACGCALHSVGKNKCKEDTLGIVQRTAELLQMFAILQLRGTQPRFKKNNLKTTMKVNHFGDLRARLEVAIARVRDMMIAVETTPLAYEGDYSSDSESPTVLCNVQITTAVRKLLAPSIRDLVQHGTYSPSQSHSVVPFIGCFSRRHSDGDACVHVWELILEYYSLKNGEGFNATPARKLSQSFNLDIAGSSVNSSKQSMLGAIGSIISTHARYKRSYDAHFKAFVCAALNANKLVTWLSLIFQCKQLINMYYLPWSYVMKTGFQDGLQSLDTLTRFSFDLPVDLAVRQFQNIKDVFT
ncbi:RUN domain-containing protein 1 isoform X2 [Atheta coriaria]